MTRWLRRAQTALAGAILVACPSPRPAPTHEVPGDAAAPSSSSGKGAPASASPRESSAVAPPAPSEGAREWLRLVAKHELGVPLHPAQRAQGVSGRLPDGSRVRVLQKSSDGRWLEVLAPDGQRGWITARYASSGVPPATPDRVELARDSAHHSRAACENGVRDKRAKRAPGRARIMSYNVRHFPDGSRGVGTDIDWLACVMASSNADVIAVQEFKNRRHAGRELDQLLARLDALTEGRWAAALDDCPGAMHVGILYDQARVKAEALTSYPSLNPHGEACKNQLRPGFGGYFRFSGGFDAHVVSVHLKSAPTRRAVTLRRQSILGLEKAVTEAQAARQDSDVVFAGDLNSMGCEKCSPKLDSAAELAEFDRLLSSTRPALRRVSAEPGCSHYYRGEGALLDHFVVTASLGELSAAQNVQVGGYCGALACRPLAGKQEPSAYQRLSDHCPIVLEFEDRDQD